GSSRSSANALVTPRYASRRSTTRHHRVVIDTDRGQHPSATGQDRLPRALSRADDISGRHRYTGWPGTTTNLAEEPSPRWVATRASASPTANGCVEDTAGAWIVPAAPASSTPMAPRPTAGSAPEDSSASSIGRHHAHLSRRSTRRTPPASPRPASTSTVPVARWSTRTRTTRYRPPAGG